MKAGLPPGTVVYVGKERLGTPQINAYLFDETLLEAHELLQPDALPDLIARRVNTWINVDGIHDAALLTRVADILCIHPLTQEDIANTTQRPKLEAFDDYLYLVLKMIYWEEASASVLIEQVSMVLRADCVVTFQEDNQDVFPPLRERLKTPGTRLRNMKADYLFFALIDIVVSNYFGVLERFEARLEAVEDQIYNQPGKDILYDLQRIKKDLLLLRRSMYPLRDVVNQLVRTDHPCLSKRTNMYFQDLRDQIYHVTEALDTYQGMVSNLHELYLALSGHRMNEVMKVLTIISTIFIPLTFIAGVYGMNFQYMPELSWRYSYFVVWGLMATLTLGLVWFFRRKGWM
ncbi:MAG: magnesium/cobalt transporter CorA [Bacteroidia bacterium]